MKNLVFVTGNSYKFEVAKKALDQAGIEVIQQKLDAPEIQSTDASEIASYSAKWAANKLGKPAVVTDAGYYIEALHGFPGPFIKFINKWLTAQDLIKLMKGKANRKAEIKICMAYCEPGQEPVNFVTKVAGTIALKPGTPTDGGSAMDRVFITEGFEKVDSEIAKEEMVKFWMGKEHYWEELAEYLSKNS